MIPFVFLPKNVFRLSAGARNRNVIVGRVVGLDRINRFPLELQLHVPGAQARELRFVAMEIADPTPPEQAFSYEGTTIRQDEIDQGVIITNLPLPSALDELDRAGVERPRGFSLDARNSRGAPAVGAGAKKVRDA